MLRAAIDLADERGVDAVSMRRLGQILRVEAMSLYRHVESKEDILDGMADLVMSEIEVPASVDDWKAAVRRSAMSAHDVLLRHPWASALIESRVNAGPARLRYLDAIIGILAGAGFAMPMVVQAFMALDSHIYGFTLQELSWPFDSVEYAGHRRGAAAAAPGCGLPEPGRDDRDGDGEPERRAGGLRLRARPDPGRPRSAPKRSIAGEALPGPIPHWSLRITSSCVGRGRALSSGS